MLALFWVNSSKSCAPQCCRAGAAALHHHHAVSQEHPAGLGWLGGVRQPRVSLCFMLTPRLSGGDRSPALVLGSVCPHLPRGYSAVLCPRLSRFVSSFCPVSHPVLPSVCSMPDPFHRRSRALSTEAQLGFAACSKESGKCRSMQGNRGHVECTPWRGRWGQHCWFSCTPGTAA